MKGIFYSVMAFLLILPIAFYTVHYLDVVKEQRGDIALKVKGNQLADYSESISLDLPRSLEIAGKQSITVAINHIDDTGEYLNNASMVIIELMEKGTIYGNVSSLMPSTLDDWISGVILIGKRYGFQTNISINNLTIKPHDSFHLALNTTISVNISSDDMNVIRRYNEGILISIEGFEDPLYPLSTYGKISRVIKRANTTVYGVEEVDNVISNQFYMASDDGPSFLDRLEGSLSISGKYQTGGQIGLESIVDLSELSAVGLGIKSTQSNIDYLYFDSATHTGYPVNQSSYSWFKLDDDHANTYGVDLIK